MVCSKDNRPASRPVEFFSLWSVSRGGGGWWAFQTIFRMFERCVARSENKSICCGGHGDETPPEKKKKKTISAAICVKQWSETATDVCKTLCVIKTMDVAFRLPESPVFTPEQISGCSTEMAKLRFQPRKERQAPVGQLCFFLVFKPRVTSQN